MPTSSLLDLFVIPSESILIYGHYHGWLVILSIFIAIFASFMGLQVASQVTPETKPARRHSMLLIGSFALGGGIWSMHFIGMLAFDLCTNVEYNGHLTFISMLPGIFASWVALNFLTQNRKGFIPLLIGGVLVGAGIGAMHYTGMAAMEMAPLLRYDTFFFILSIVVAVTLSMLSLWIHFGLTSLNKPYFKRPFPELLASAIMGCAITGMHYTGMAAARFVRPPGLELSEQTSETSMYLALGISVTTAIIICLVLGLNLILKYKDISIVASENEHRLRAMMATAVDGIISIDSNGIILNINQATEKLLGWQSNELTGKNVNILVPAPFHGEHDGYLKRYLETGEANIIGKGREVSAVHKDGSLVAIRLAIGHVNLNSGDIFVAFISDIRPRLKMEQALRENEEKFRSLITNIPGIAYRCKDTPEWPMIYISDAVENLTGYAPEDFLLPDPTISFSQLYHPEDKEKIIDKFNFNGPFKLEYRIIDRAGQERWMMEQGTHIKDLERNETWIDGFIMDITERKEMEQALRQAKDRAEQAATARANFMANMSHEIRTPMNAIIGFSDILIENNTQLEQQHHLKTINNSAKSLLHLLNDILDSAKLDKGKLELEKRNFSLYQEVDEVISTLWLQARNKNLQLSVEVSPKLRDAYFGSPERIRQVLTNLLSNAIKFTEHGTVKVSVEPQENNIINFVIEDTGIGMTQAQLQKVFDAFTQADASMSRRFGGTGLGTTISKQLVELMGGTITAQSTKGVGSQFSFTLPLKPVSTPEIEQKQENIALPKLTILVVDDIQQNIELLTLLLEREGHRVITARDGQQALIRMASEDNLDLVIMDIQMPVKDGLTASRERREYELNKRLKRLPIIAFTASVLKDDKLAAKQAGMDGFAKKPVDLHALFSEIARVLDITTVEEPLSVQDNTQGKLIDERKGVALWGSKEDFYNQINLFITQYESNLANLATLFEQQQWPTLQAELHKLKGICGNLSLTKLMRQLEKLETVATTEQQQAKATLHDIAESIDQLKSVVTTQIQQKAIADVNNKSDNLCDLTEALKALKSTLEQNEIDETILDQLTQYQMPQFASEIEAITSAVNDFEFSQAVMLTEQLIKKVS
ncbi:histidine kinase [Pseudoalteromonas phenolica]|nr:histidine kinase [Pseudoalteromonas phenolica]